MYRRSPSPDRWVPVLIPLRQVALFRSTQAMVLTISRCLSQSEVTRGWTEGPTTTDLTQGTLEGLGIGYGAKLLPPPNSWRARC
jgi:hypothetical protein